MAIKSNIYYTSGTCSQAILTEIDGDTITRVQFVGGCSGNTTGIAALVAGMKIEDAISRLEGYETLCEYPEYMDQIVIGTFHDEIEAELKEKYSDLLRGAPTGTAAKFVLTQYLGVNIFDDSDFACLQIPTSYDLGIEIYLDSKSLIDRAHRRNIAVQYWTINDPDEMRKLIELGCDCIMTDNPKLLKEVLEEYKK